MRTIRRVVLIDSGFTAEFPSDETGKTVPSSPKPKDSPDDYFLKLAKYVPSEVIVLYTALNCTLRAAHKDNTILTVVPFILSLVGLYFYLYRMQEREMKSGDKLDKICWGDIHISAISFILWTSNLGGPIALIPGYSDWGPLACGLTLPAFTFIAPLLKRSA
jgi:hypothetical protein